MRKVVEGAAVWLAIVASSVPAMAWEPTKPVEIVVAAGAGGASDQMARMMQAAIQKNGLMKQPIVVSLKGDAIIVGDGMSCRHQIKDGTGREVVHVARVLARSLMAM